MRTSRVAGIGWLILALATPCVSADPAKDSKPGQKADPATPPTKAAPAKAAPAKVPEGLVYVDAQAFGNSTRIEKALDEPTEIEVIEAPLTDVVEYLRKRHHIEIQLSEKALEEAGVALDTQITRNLKDISLRSALRLMLRDLELTYVIRDEVLQITTVSDAETIFTTRVYPVGDLLSSTSDEIPRLNPAEDLTEVITTTVAPTTWSEVGGAGSTSYLPSARSLVISQTREVHEEICGLLAAMRKVQAATGLAAGTQAADDHADKMLVVTYFLKSSTAAAKAPADGGKSSSQTAGTAGAEHNLADDLARAVQKLVEPASWQDGGGQGGIESIGVGVVVRQNRRMQLQVMRFLQPFSASTAPAETSGGGSMF